MRVSYKIIAAIQRKRKDNTIPINIRIGWRSKYAFITTDYSVFKSDLTKKGELKASHILDKCNITISEYRKITDEIDENSISDVQDIIEIIKTKTEVGEEIDFLKFFTSHTDTLIKSNAGSAQLYKATLNHLNKYVKGDKLEIARINPNFLQSFDEYLVDEGVGDRGRNIYLGRIRAVYNLIMDEYEHLGYTFAYPFRKFKLPKVKPPKTVALTKEELLKIINLELPEGSRAKKAQMIFTVSLFSLGTNGIDLFNLKESKGGRIEYNRSKTKDKRDDSAFISIKIEEELLNLIEKMKGEPPYLLCINQWYANTNQLNKAVRLGLRQIAEILEMDYFVFYDARRTFASIMRNRLGISKDDIALCLNHVDMSHTVTNQYIETDFSILDRCNRKFLDYLFDKGEYAPK